jgi:organic radical activating enzyme
MNQYQPGIHKLIYHPEQIVRIVQGVLCAPLHISVWPTKRCQFKCDYCAFRNDPDGGDELDACKLIECLLELQAMGLKAVEFSGGGEPTLWPELGTAALRLSEAGLSVSLITNGLRLKEIENISSFKWIRVSLQSTEHAESVDFTAHKRISASYMVSDSSNVAMNKMLDVMDYCNNHKITLRIGAVQPQAQDVVDAIRHYILPPAFFTFKPAGAPKACYLPWVRAAIDWRGNLLACPATQLAAESAGKVAGGMVLCSYENAAKWYMMNAPKDMGFRCSTCVCGKEINDYLHDVAANKLPEDSEFV